MTNLSPLFHLNILLVILCGSLPGLANSINNVQCGSEWINIHKENKNLLGVYIMQLPDNLADAKEYENKHPVTVNFVFKNGQVHSVNYSPSGQVQDGSWFTLPKDSEVFNELITDLKETTYCAWWVK